MDIEALVKSSHRACNVLKSMANEHRLLALCNLAEGEKSVGELQKLLPLSQSALSQHLAILRRENLVKTRKSAQSVYYSLSSPEVIAIMATLHDVFCGVEPEKT